MESATTWLGISMVFLIAILLKRGISYAVIVGVTFATDALLVQGASGAALPSRDEQGVRLKRMPIV